MLVLQYYSVKRSACVIAQYLYSIGGDEVSVKYHLDTSDIVNNLVSSHNIQLVTNKVDVRTVDISLDSR